MNMVTGSPSVPPRCPVLLVSGANGFVMSNAIPVWLQLGYRIIAVDQVFSEENLRAWEAVNGKPLQYVVSSIDHHLLADLPPVDAIVHGAAITADPETAGMTPEAHLRANLDPALALLEWAGQDGECRCICISSSAVYAETTGIVTEDQPVTPLGTYAVAKASIEAAIATLKQDYRRDALVVRLGNIYGINEQPTNSRPRISLIGRMLHEALTQGVIHLPQNVQPDLETREWTFAPDIGFAIHALLQTPSLNYPLYNVAAGEQADRFEIAAIIRDLLPDVRFVTGQQKDNPALKRRGILSHARLYKDTEFSGWTPLEEGIRRVLEHELGRQTA